ncbi:MAG: hypothetical protein SVY15_00645 [Halobacteriota archaeon]|nr:hypothetical protein [Halobacteriota archaeon]
MGRSKKEYRPDYLLSINKIPIVAIDTKHPDDDPDNGLKDALMYARTTNNGSIENLTKLRYNRITSPIY